MDIRLGEIVLRVERMQVASGSLFISLGTSGSSKMGRGLHTPVYHL